MEKLNVGDLLNQVKKDKKDIKKDAKNLFPASDNQKKMVEEIIQTRETVENLCSQLKTLEEEIKTAVAGYREEEAEKGKYSQTYYLPGQNDRQARCTFTNKFSKIKDEYVGDLKQVCGEHDLDFNNLFETAKCLQIKSSILEDEKKVQTLIEKLGKELFLEMFEYSTFVKPAEDFDRKQFSIAKEARKSLSLFVTQASPMLVTK